MADRVIRYTDTNVAGKVATGLIGASVQRKCASCEEEGEKKKPIMRKATSGIAGINASDSLVSSLNATKGGGSPLPQSTRSFMENAFSTDFSGVRVHTGHEATEMSRGINAKAFTAGSDIYFNSGKYNPDIGEGKQLLAHELTHVVQQGGSIQTKLIQRDCDDSNFCTPYPTAAEAAAAKYSLRSFYLPAEEAKFGANSRALYESYLSRTPGDSLAPVIFNNPSSDVVASFSASWATANDQDAIIDLVGNRLSRAPGGPLRDFTTTMMSLANFLSPVEMDNRPINYSNPFSIAGHIAGGIGSSDAGPDYRKINYGNVTLEKIPVIGGTGYVSVETTLQYEVFDAVDFCPGDCGSPAEQLITIPMSRLEAGGEAYDVPFKVNFTPESRSKRFWY